MTRPFSPAVLALLLCGIAAAADSTFHGKTFEQWKAQLSKGTSQDRGRAAMALGLGPFGKEAVPVLIEALRDREADVRFCVIAALGEVGPRASAAITPLAGLLHPKNQHRAIIVHALGRIGPEAAPFLLDALVAQTADREDVGRAFQAMGPAAVPILVQALKHDNSTVRCMALEVFRHLGRAAEPAVPAIAALLNPETVVDCRCRAFTCLAALGPSARAAIPTLVKLMDGEEYRFEAATTLVSIGQPAYPAIRRILNKGPRAARRSILANLQPDWEDALPLLLAHLKDEDKEARSAAASGLLMFYLDLGEHIPRLRQSLNDPNEWVRTNIYRALTPTSEEATLLLARGVLDENYSTRHTAWVSLRNLRGRSLPGAVTPVFLRALKDTREDVRQRAATSLQFADPSDPAVVRALCDALHDRVDDVRIAAALSLGRHGVALRDVRIVQEQTAVDLVVPALQARMHDENAVVRLCAASALCCVGYPNDAAIRLIARTLVDPPGDVHDVFTESDLLLGPATEAKIALWRCGNRAAIAVPILVKGLVHQDDRVRWGVAETLGDLGAVARPAVPALATALDDQNVHVRIAAVRALVHIGPEGCSALSRALEGKDADLKRQICSTLQQEMPAAKALVRIVERVTLDADAQVRWAAVHFLAEAGACGEPLRTALMRLLETDSEFARSWACEQLARFGAGAAAAVPRHKLLLLDPSPTVRSKAALALAAVDAQGKEALPSLLETLSERDGTVRRAALAALGHLGSAAKAALSRVQAALKDTSELVRVEAAVALWRISSRKEDSLIALKILSSEARGTTRVDAVVAQRQIEKSREQLDLLVRLLQDEDEPTRQRAADTLASMGAEARPVVPVVRALMKHRSYVVRRAAADLLDSLAEKKEKR